MSSTMEIESDEVVDAIRFPHPETDVGLTLVLDLRRAVRTLLCIVAVLIVSGTIANTISNQVAPSPEHKLAKLMNRFDLAFEPSVPNWYSSCTLLASSILLALIGLSELRLRNRFFKHWIVLAVLFLGLSIDEGVRFHEMIHTVIASRVETHGVFYFPWVVPALIFVAIVGLCYIPFLKHLDRRTAVMFLGAGATYVMGAVGMDMVGGVIVEQTSMTSFAHTLAQAMEELLEMLGIVLFVYTLLSYLRRRVGSVSVRIVSEPAA